MNPSDDFVMEEKALKLLASLHELTSLNIDSQSQTTCNFCIRKVHSVINDTIPFEMLLDKGIVVHVLNMGLMDNTPTGKLIRNIMLAFSEFERDMIVERTSEGKAIAKMNPDFREGRPKKFSNTQINHALSLLENHFYRQVEQMTGISKSTLIRKKKTENKA